MTARQILAEQLIRHEGIELSAYQDSLGYWTIGVGHCIDARVGGSIPHAIAMRLLDLKLDEAVLDLSSFLWFVKLDDVRQRALIDMRYNLGPAHFRAFAKMIAALERQDYSAAALQMLDSTWADQVGKRAVDLAMMVGTGEEVTV
jgi:lysozyme